MTTTGSGFLEEAWSVARVTAEARRYVEGGIGQIWVRGAIVGLKIYQSGHWYFTLRDSEAQIRCVMWRTMAARTSRKPDDGVEVYALAAPTVWEEKGELRLTVSVLLPTAEISPEQQLLERTKAALQKDGLLDPSKKRPLPGIPGNIALVTSLDGAALRDLITVARRRWPAVRLLVFGTRVQGAEAETEIVAALKLVNRIPGIDLCILGRGGGASEDLRPFNSEPVCRALADVQVPTISAVGHETDILLTDLVADYRAATPSAAMEVAVPDGKEVALSVATAGRAMARALEQRTRLLNERLERYYDRLGIGMQRVVGHTKARLTLAESQLDALSPLRVLERGYAVARLPGGQVVKNALDLPSGQLFTLRISDGEVIARAE